MLNENISRDTHVILRVWKPKISGQECYSAISLTFGTLWNFYRSRFEPGMIGHASLELVQNGNSAKYVSLYPNVLVDFDHIQQIEQGIGHHTVADEVIYLYSLDVSAMISEFDSIRNLSPNGVPTYGITGYSCVSLVRRLLEFGGLNELFQHEWIGLYTPNNISATVKHAKNRELTMFPVTSSEDYQQGHETQNSLSFIERWSVYPR